MNRKVLGAVLAIAGLSAGSGAHAGLALAPLFNTFPDSTLLSDNSAEFWIDRDSSGTINLHDILFGIIGINTIGPTTIGSGTVYNELTVFQANKISAVDNTRAAPGGQGVAGITIADYTAVALDAADAAYFDWSTGIINLDGVGSSDYTFTTAFGATNNGKTFALAFEDAAPDYTRNSTVQAGLTTATNGAARLLVDVDTTTDLLDEVLVTAPINPVAAALILGNPPPADVSFSGSSISINGTIAAQNWPGLTLLSNITGGNGGFSTPSSGTLNSGDPWSTFDNTDFTVRAAQVPEPGSLALLSVGLLGIGGFARRRSTKHA